jgi:hypothetical protein
VAFNILRAEKKVVGGVGCRDLPETTFLKIYRKMPGGSNYSSGKQKCR